MLFAIRELKRTSSDIPVCLQYALGHYANVYVVVSNKTNEALLTKVANCFLLCCRLNT